MKFAGLLLSMYALIATTSISAAAVSNGPDSFQKHCSNCHGVDAKGGPPFFPSLVERVKTQELDEIINMILTGRFSVEADLAHTVPIMPGWDHLANEDLADIVNFLYSNAGIKSPLITTEDVAFERGRLQNTQDATALSEEGFNRAKQQYFYKCAGCHGVHREGAAASALTDWLMRSSGSHSLKEILHYGSPWGMPNWGVSERMTAEDMGLMARFLQLPAPPAPRFGIEAITASWQELVPVKKRPSRRKFKVHPADMFVSLLHDVGQVVLIDAKSKAIVEVISTGLAPHSIDISKNGRYLYVISRSGDVGLIDLYMERPQVVARVKTGFEARSFAISRAKRNNYLVAGAYWPPQITILHPETLRPFRTQLLDQSLNLSRRSEARVSQVVSFGIRTASFIVATSESGELFVVSPEKANELGAGHKGAAFLRAGSFDRSGRYFLIPADDEQVVVFDTKNAQVITTIDVEGLVGGNSGTNYVDPLYGPVWATSAMGSSVVVVIGTDPDKHPENAWRVVRSFRLPTAGSLSIETHEKSGNLWVDTPLNVSTELSNSVYAFDRNASDPTIHTLPIAEWAGFKGQKVRVLHPQYSKGGDEIWFTVFDRQDRASAIVIVNDTTRKLKYVLRDNRLITPTRTYSIASMLEQ